MNFYLKREKRKKKNNQKTPKTSTIGIEAENLAPAETNYTQLSLSFIPNSSWLFPGPLHLG